MTKGLALAYHSLSLLLEAGVPLLRALDTVSSTSPPRLAKAFEKVADGARRGIPLADTMAAMRGIFDPVDTMLINAAETSGSLPESLDLLSNWHEFSGRMKSRMLSGLLLPIFVLHIAAFVIPVPTLVLGGWNIPSYFRSAATFLAVFYIPAAVIWVILHMTPRTGRPRWLLDFAALRIPVLGRAVQKMALSRYAWVFHMLAKAGVPATESAEKAADATSNAVIADQFKPGAASAKAGHPVFEGFSKKIPFDFLNIWQVGEDSGTIVEVTKRLADRNGEDAEFWFNEFARWVPRLVYFLVMIFLAIEVLKGWGALSSSMTSF